MHNNCSANFIYFIFYMTASAVNAIIHVNKYAHVIHFNVYR